MEVRDPVHGSIPIHDDIVPIIRHDFFQRLRNIKQLGFSEYVFPGATHTRFIHSIGVMDISRKAFIKLFEKNLSDPRFQKLNYSLQLACLLHDIGHAPLSHSTEYVMPKLKDLNIPKEFLFEEDYDSERQATHEDYTIKAIADSSFAQSFEQVEKNHKIVRARVADLIVGKTEHPEYFTVDGVNYFILLHQLVSSEMDCDRMDYLLRDSYFCGVSYGGYDLDWLLDNLEICIIDNKAHLGITERAVVTFDDFLLSRYHMFVMVYFHYRAVCLEQLLMRYFKTSPNEYRIPADIEEYIEHDDHYLMKIMRKSENPYAQQIIKNQIPPKIYESFNPHQLKKLEEIQKYAEENDIEVIRCSSLGRLSKYYTEEEMIKRNSYSMKVVRKLYDSDKKIFFDINQATDLFEKFSKSHEINRLHCNISELSQTHQDNLNRLIRS